MHWQVLNNQFQTSLFIFLQTKANQENEQNTEMVSKPPNPKSCICLSKAENYAYSQKLGGGLFLALHLPDFPASMGSRWENPDSAEL